MLNTRSGIAQRRARLLCSRHAAVPELRLALSRVPSGRRRRRDRRFRLRARCAARDRRDSDRHGLRRVPASASRGIDPCRAVSGCEHRAAFAGDHRDRCRSSVSRRARRARGARPRLPPGPPGGTCGGLPARDPRGPQRRVRSFVPERRDPAYRPQAQPVPCIQLLRHRQPRRTRLRPDRAQPADRGGWHVLG